MSKQLQGGILVFHRSIVTFLDTEPLAEKHFGKSKLE